MFRFPDLSDWLITCAALFGFGALATAFGLWSGLFTYAPRFDTALLRTAAIAFVLPAFMEELVFRGPLLRYVTRTKRPARLAVGVSLLLFVLWHPFNAAFILTGAQDLFFDPRFLVIATGLGIVATWLALHTRSLVPPIIFHWLAVVGWKTCLGAPTYF